MRPGEGIVVFLAGFFGVFGALQVPPPSAGDTWAGVAPMAVSCLLILCGAVMIVRGGFRLSAFRLSSLALPSRAAVEVFALSVFAFVYYWAMVSFGYVLPTFVAAPAVFAAFGMRGFVKLGAAAMLCPLVFYLLFFVILGAHPPRGEVWEVLDYIGN